MFDVMTAVAYYTGLRPPEVVMLRPRALTLPDQAGDGSTSSKPTSAIASRGGRPCAERWRDPATGRRRARLLAVDDAGAAYLLALEHGRWASKPPTTRRGS